MKINKHTLANGLRIVHVEDKATQMVTVNVLYCVGSRNEDAEHTGFAHLFEHLMFGGTEAIPHFDSVVEQASGENNAFTTSDYTNYYLTLPAENIETAFWVESDRMTSLAFTEESLEVQRKVVMEEFKEHYITQPYGDLDHLMSSLAFRVHPYRWPTIGLKLDHIANVQMPEVRDFFFRYYAPNNAILSVVGNVSFDEVVHLAEKWFGPIPQRHIDQTPIPQEPEQTEQRRMTVERNVPNDLIYFSFPIVGEVHPDFNCCDMISDILGMGRSCRLHRHLVDEQRMFNELDAFVVPQIDPCQLGIVGLLTDGVSLDEAEGAIWKELDTLCADGITEHELEKVKNKYESNFMKERIKREKQAAQLAFYEMLGDAEMAETAVERYRAITAEQFMNVCRRVLRREKASILHYKKSYKLAQARAEH